MRQHHYAPYSGRRWIPLCQKKALGTNTDLDAKYDISTEDQLLTMKNKWLIAHEEAGIEGAFNGLRGTNITLE